MSLSPRPNTQRRPQLLIARASALLVAVAVCATALSTGTGLAAAEIKAQPHSTVPTLRQGTQTARDTSTLRCWQYGELLFEQAHLQAKTLSEKNRMLVFESDGGKKDRELYLIDIGSATCLYEKI